MGMGGGGSSSGKSDFPDYMKMFHYTMLAGQGDVNGSPVDVLSMSVTDAFNIAVAGNSPYYNFTTNGEPIAQAFMETGSTINSYGKIFKLLKAFQEIDFDTTKASYSAGLIDDISIALDDDININVLPKFKANLRGIGAVNSSAFVIGEALIWDSKIKALAKERIVIEEFALKATLAFIDNKKMIALATADVVKVYYSLKSDIDTHYAQMGEHDMKWDLEMFQYLNNTMAAISGAALAQGTKKNQVGGAVSGALAGAAMGALAGSAVPVVGTAVGAVAGGILGLAGGISG